MIFQTMGGEKVRRLDQVLLSLGIACALSIGGLTYVLRSRTAWAPVNDSTYLAFRGVYRIVDLLHLQSTTPVATSVMQRQMPSSGERLGIEIAILVTVLGVGAGVWLVLSLISYARSADIIVRRLTLAILIFAAPACYLTVSWLTWAWPQNDLRAFRDGSFFRGNLAVGVFIGEMACVSALVLRRYFQRRVTPKWAVALFVLFHFAFWIFAIGRDTRFWFFPIYSHDIVLLLILALPLVHILQRGHQLDRMGQSGPTLWGIGVGIALLIPLGAVWAPPKTVQLGHPQNLDTLKIELGRGPCYGSCPQYTFTVRGDGRVEYVGRRGHSRFDTRKLGSIEREKVMRILHTLDRVKFMTLEDRAFSWAFDTPSVGIRIWEDGKTKQVVSDSAYVGYKYGRQASFVEATRGIDGILESTQWTQCTGEECVKPLSSEPSPD